MQSLGARGIVTNTPRYTPAHIALARRLGMEIASGRYQPGDQLPREVETADSLKISRSVVREAQRILSAKGLVESRAKAGTRVRERRHWNMLDPELLGWMFEGAPPIGFVRNLFDLRMIVEPAAAETAALCREADQLARMGHALEEMSRHGLASERGRAADQTFHTLILEATGNEILVSLSAGISAAIRWTTQFKFTRSPHPRDPIAEHRALFESIAKQDGVGAREATVVLIRQALVDTELLLPDRPTERDDPSHPDPVQGGPT